MTFDSAAPASGGAGPARFPLYGPEFAADPAAAYARMRARGPIVPVELSPGVPASLVIGYDTALDVLRDPGTFPKDPRRWEAKIPADCPVLPMMMYRPNCLFADGAVHARLRGAVTDSLARVDASAVRGYVERNADTLIDHFAPSGEADLLGQYAQILPLLVFNELFGCPPDIGDRLVYGMRGIFDGVDAEKANAELTRGVADLVALKRERPGADVTSWLLDHPAELTDEEVMHQLVVLQGGGTEPEQNLIANGMRLLLYDDRFAGDLSGGSLPVEDALDEILWTDPPMANYGVTYPRRDVELAGVRLPADEPVVVSFAAANTDPSKASEHRAGNRAHLAWSTGPHTCPAKGPARLIASTAIERLLDRLPDLEPAVPVDRLEWRPGPFHRALAALPVRFPAEPVHTVPGAGARPEADTGTDSGADSGEERGEDTGAGAARASGPSPDESDRDFPPVEESTRRPEAALPSRLRSLRDVLARLWTRR
ncbi:cytochrome P450 [Nocardiopsis gilva]|uniref:cytochrome P450 n=1 Tax=Nocardiopsis gilva TaxID=280236 RepID=UPI000348B24F|nr:cytochrome P450 [Nocardiopsis gilva]